MSYLLILLVNLIYLPTIWSGVVNDDASIAKFHALPIKRCKIRSIILHITIAEYIYAAFGSTPTSLVAAMLFSIHPLGVQIPLWFSARYYGIQALMFLFILKFAPFSAPVYFLGYKWAVGPLFLTPLLFFFTSHWQMGLIFIPLCWFGLVWLLESVRRRITRVEVFASTISPDFSLHIFKWRNLVLVVKTFGYYALASLLPIKNGFFNSFLTTLGSSKKETDYWYSLNRHFWGGLFALVLMAVIWWFNKSNFIGMGILLFGLSIGPFLNFITVQQFTASRYAYLPLIGFQVALVGVIIKYLPYEMGVFLFGGLAFFYLDRLIRVFKHYQTNDQNLVVLDSEVFPDNPRVWYLRYERQLHLNNPIMAWAEATYGLKHLPEDCQLWFGLACATYDMGDIQGALFFLEKSEQNMILAERASFAALVAEFKSRIMAALEQKWKPPLDVPRTRRF
jgi:hypothetical protein